MNIKIDLNITLPDGFIQALANLTGHNAAAPAARAPKAEKAAAVTSAPVAEAQPAPTPAAPETAVAAAPVNVTDEMIIAAADAAVVKVGSNPQIIKQAVAARFQKEDGSPGTLMTTRKDQRPALHAFLVSVGQTGNVNA